MKRPGSIAWYVSSHGWGHASRQREVIRGLLAGYPGLRISVVSMVPEWFWSGMHGLSLFRRIVGPVPIEAPGTTDVPETGRCLRAFPSGWREALSLETDFLRASRADMVVSDIEAMPFEAARLCGLPATGIANFTWDWVFRNLIPDSGDVCDLLALLYSSGTYLRLPLGPALHPFEKCIEIPLLPGGVPGDPDRAKALLGDEPTILVTLRDQGRLAGPVTAPPGWQVVSSLPEPVPGVTLNLPPSKLAESGLRFADLVACADTVLLTPGYGIVSQVLALGKRAVVIRRHEFPETPFLMGPLEDRPGTVVRDARELTGPGLGDAARLSLEGPPPAVVDAGGLEACISYLSEGLRNL